MATSDFYTSSRDRKLVVLGVPWDVDTDGLKEYMSKFGELDDVIVMKDRATGRSRGFGYVTFSSAQDAQKVSAMQHALNGRMLEVKVATPKEEMRSSSTRKVTRIFVARIPLGVTDDMFRSYFAKYGVITDSYMPKDQGSRAHRGIGFVTFENAESVDKLMNETHELGGSMIAVDRATPKEETLKFWGKALSDGYGAYNAYMSAAAQFGTFGAGPLGAYNYPGSDFPNMMGAVGMESTNVAGNSWAPRGEAVESTNVPGNSWAENGGVAGNTDVPGNPWAPNSGIVGGSSHPTPVATPSVGHTGSTGHSFCAPSAPSTGMGNKVFIGRLPVEATAEHLRTYFSRFGRILDVYVPKDAEKKGHRGFGFVTFFDDGVAERVALETHEILGQSIAVDRPTPQDGTRNNTQFMNNVSTPSAISTGSTGPPFQGSTPVPSMGYGASQQGNISYNNMWGSYDSSGVGPVNSSTSRTDFRYRPY